ncbi:MAG: septum formation initiator family protein [Thermoflexales bacterium]|nr:septum formation initiator family protein [Thermoflexales bacterium]
MAGKSSGVQRWLILGAILVVLVVAGLIGRGVWRQIAHLRHLLATEAELRAQIQYEQTRQQQLEQELRHVSSPDYPEEWARRYGGMVLPGEVLLVVPDSAGTTPNQP